MFWFLIIGLLAVLINESIDSDEVNKRIDERFGDVSWRSDKKYFEELDRQYPT